MPASAEYGQSLHTCVDHYRRPNKKPSAPVGARFDAKGYLDNADEIIWTPYVFPGKPGKVTQGILGEVAMVRHLQREEYLFFRTASGGVKADNFATFISAFLRLQHPACGAFENKMTGSVISQVYKKGTVFLNEAAFAHMVIPSRRGFTRTRVYPDGGRGRCTRRRTSASSSPGGW